MRVVVQRSARWRGCWQILGMVSRDAQHCAALCGTESGAGGGVGDANAMAMPPTDGAVAMTMAPTPMTVTMPLLPMELATAPPARD